MGKPTGFMEIARRVTEHRSPLERIQDYDEFLLPTEEGHLREQCARCIDCGVPFCHAGMQTQGTSIGCPLCNLIPETNDLLYRGDMKAAYARLAKTHPFPEITGRVCPALCEGSCTLGEHEEPVTVRDIERALADYGWAQGLVAPHQTAPPTGKTVAVVGSGPAGLACADMLSRAGHAVTVYEQADRPGGFMMYGIPNMKLDKGIVMDRADLLRQQGVRFVLGCKVGQDLPALQLVKEHDAVVLCAGARAERRMQAPGADAKGVYTAVDYLTENTRRLLDDGRPEGYINAEGKDVLVVGGGDTGTDCVATAIRQGAKSVTQIEIMPPLPDQRAADNPWPLWPRVRKRDYGLEEAEAVFGRDIREYETTVKEVLTKEGEVVGVTTVRVRWEKDPSGRMRPEEIPGTEQEREAQLVLTAMGFTGPEALLPEALHLARDARGMVQAAEGDSTGAGGYRTSLPTVFATGDMRRGPSLVVWAILEGMRAAEQCHQYLQEEQGR